MEPALTQEEWALVKENGLCGVADAHTLNATGEIHYLDEHAVAALHLQGHFTWEDVRQLEAACIRVHPGGHGDHDPEEICSMLNLAGRIARLLPPRLAWEDVDLLRDTAQEVSYIHQRATAVKLANLADRIEALLPPRESEA